MGRPPVLVVTVTEDDFLSTLPLTVTDLALIRLFGGCEVIMIAGCLLSRMTATQ